MPVQLMEARVGRANSKIVPGEQAIQVNLTMVFELQ
jgi:hypothetical protein